MDPFFLDNSAVRGKCSNLTHGSGWCAALEKRVARQRPIKQIVFIVFGDVSDRYCTLAAN